MARRARKERSGKALIVTGSIVLLFIGAFDAIFVHKAWTQWTAQRSWDQVPAEVLSSRIRVESDSEGSSYYPEVRYAYEVAGQRIEGDRVSLGMAMSFGRRLAERTVERFPVGAEVTAWVDPEDPNRAALVVDGSDGSAFPILFLTPFHCMGAGFLAAGLLRRRRRGPGALGRLVHVDDGEHLVLASPRLHPVLVFLITLGGAAFFATFAVGFFVLGRGGSGIVQPLLLGFVAVAAGASHWQKRRLDRPERFLHLDLVRRTWAHPADAEPRPLPAADRLRVKSRETNTRVNDVPVHEHVLLTPGEDRGEHELLRFRGPERLGEDVLEELRERL